MPLDHTDDKSTLVQECLGAVRQQTVTRANIDPDLCRHLGSLGHNELIWQSSLQFAQLVILTESNGNDYLNNTHYRHAYSM